MGQTLEDEDRVRQAGKQVTLEKRRLKLHKAERVRDEYIASVVSDTLSCPLPILTDL